MANIAKGVFDTGPILHLHEIEGLHVLTVVKLKYISQEVEDELLEYAVSVHTLKNVMKPSLSLQYKNVAKIIAEQYALDLGEATSIALAQQEKISFFFTDDLDAREIAKTFHLEVHGSLGILLRAFREKEITKDEAILLVKKISTTSSLFLTSDLVHWITQEIKNYKI